MPFPRPNTTPHQHTMKKLLTTIALAGVLTAGSQAQIRITEVMSSSGTGGTADWFEVTNFDLNNPVDITGWRMDDNTFSFANSVALNGITSIGAGETVVFLESADPGTDIPTFRTVWGPAAATIGIGSYTGSGVGFSSNGDGVVVFDAGGTEQTPQTSFGAATTGSSFFWGYNASGNFDTYGSASSGVVSTVGLIAGTSSDQDTYTTTLGLLSNTGSPGTAINAVPEPSTYALLALGGAGFAAYRLRRRTRR
jgi:hypothetical protein